MIKVRVVEHDGTSHDIEAAEGETAMRAITQTGIPGLTGECGGSLSCATCHAYIDEMWIAALPTMSEMEQVMLDGAIDVRDNSRLTCQIDLAAHLDGIVFMLPKSQY